MQDIARELEALEVENFERKYYVPYNRLKRLLDRKKVSSLLEANNIPSYDRPKILNAVLNNGLRLLATLAAIDQIPCITRFTDRDYFSSGNFDSQMPLSDPVLEQTFPEEGIRRLFKKHQWRFSVPELQDDQSYREFSEATIMPFLESHDFSSGGFSVVTRVKVHRPGSMSKLPSLLIRKTLIEKKENSNVTRDFADELQILSFLRNLQHPSIIRLITAFKIGPTYNFLFPVAECDLQDVLFGGRVIECFNTSKKVLLALWSLSSALATFHNYYSEDFNTHRIGCHYDIKPRNILVLNERLVLSDFGLSRLQELEKGSRSLYKQGEGDYLAPECEAPEDGFNPGIIGRSADVWSFGCVLADILAYMKAEPGKGSESALAFRSGRKVKLGGVFVCYTFFGDRDVNSHVSKVLDQCRNESGLDGGLAMLAQLIVTILKMDPSQRPNADLITSSLFHIGMGVICKEILLLKESLEKPYTFDLEMELKYFEVFSKTVGLSHNHHNLSNAMQPALASTTCYTSLEALQTLLLDYREELLKVSRQLRGPSKERYSLAHHLRRLGDKLLETQSDFVREKIKNQLEAELQLIWDIPSVQNEVRVAQAESYQDLNHNKSMDFRRSCLLSVMKQISIALSSSEKCEQILLVAKSSLEQPMMELSHQDSALRAASNEGRYHRWTNDITTGRKVLVEIKAYTEDWISREAELIQRTNAIASLRSRGAIKDVAPVLRCSGFYHDAPRHQLGFVYEFPPDAQSKQPITLSNAILETQNRSKQPSLSQKFDLARSLASHVLDFHQGGWLHKNISSSSIIYFRDNEMDTAKRMYSLPYFIGFQHACLNEEKAFSTMDGQELMEYHHPAYISIVHSQGRQSNPSFRQSYRQEFDYYSVGMVLLEISMWRPLKQLTKKIQGSPDKLRQQIISSYLPLIRSYMGDTYADAFRYCLTMPYDLDRSLKQVHQDFRVNVVAPLEKCSV